MSAFHPATGAGLPAAGPGRLLASDPVTRPHIFAALEVVGTALAKNPRKISLPDLIRSLSATACRLPATWAALSRKS